MVSLQKLYRECLQLLTHDTAAFDLTQLFMAEFGVRPAILADDAVCSDAVAFRLKNRVSALTAGCPLQYLLGEWEFFSIPIKVGHGVLIPRPDTESVVEVAISLLRGKHCPLVADFCAGSGAISLALAANIPNIHLHAVELYAQAYAYLEENVELQGFSKLITLHQQDVLKPLCLPPLDMIISNPPYLTRKEMGELSPQVLQEPATALDGGEDGLLFYRGITQSAATLLKPNGALVFEIGYLQGKLVAEILQAQGFKNVEIHKDLTGNDRCVCGFWAI